MASYNPPTENITQFNTSLFNQPEETLSQEEADLLYLSKTKTDTSTAPLTTFNGQLVANGSSNFNSSVLIKNRYKLCEMLDFSTDTTYTLTIPLSQTYTIRTLTPAVTSITINLPAITINDAGITINLVKVKQGMNLNVIINSPIFIFALNDLGGGGTSNSTLLSVNKMMTTLMAGVSGSNTYWIELSSSSTWDRDQSNLIYPRLSTANIFTNSNTFNLGATILDGQHFNARVIKSSNTASASHSLFDNMIAGGILTIGNVASQNVLNGVTTFNQNINAKADIVCFDKNSPFTNNLTINHTTSSANYTSFAGATSNSFHNFTAYNNAGLDRVSFQVGYTQVNIPDGLLLSTRQITSSNNTAAHTLFTNLVSPATLTIGGTTSTNTIQGQTTFSNLLTASNNINTNSINGVLNTGTKSLYTSLTGTLNIGQATTTLINVKGVTTFDLDTTFTSRLNMNASSYSFPFASSQSIGYYLKATGTGTTLVTGVTKSILTTASIPIGVWRIDFSVQNVVGATGAGTITQAQSFVSTTLDGNNTTAVPFTGSIVRSHVAEVYGNNDIQLITSSFTYQQSTAGVLYLNAFRVFPTGTYSFTGEVAITRLS